MKGSSKTNQDLVAQISVLNKRIQELELSDSERKRAEEAQHESEERYLHLYEHAPFGIGMATLDGKILAANRMMQIITGFSDEELKAINLADIYVNPNYRAQLLEALKTSGDVVDYPALFKRKDGTEYNVSLTIGIVNIAGKNVVQTLVQDITRRKRMEEALQESEKAARQLAQENDLVAEIGRIIGSTLSIEEVYERFAEKVREIIPFDNVSINIVNIKNNTRTTRYSSGMPINPSSAV